MKRNLWVSFKEKSILSESQRKIIESLDPFIICAGISTFLRGHLNDIISKNFTKSYKFLLVTDDYTHPEKGRVEGATKWLAHIMEHNRLSLKFTAIITKKNSKENVIGPRFLLKGACVSIFEAIQHSDIYCKPRIMPTEYSNTYSSVFLNSKIDVIINLGIQNYCVLLASTNVYTNRYFTQIYIIYVLAFR